MFTLAQYPVPPLALQVATGPGHGPPLVLLHGVLRSWRDWAGVWPALVSRWQVFAVDHRGHGGSDRCPGCYLVRHYADDLIRLVRTRLPEGVVLFGHSLGALVAAATAAACPERVRAVILEDPPAQGFLREVAGTPWHELWSGMRELAGSTEPVAVVTRRLAEVRQGGVRLGDLRDAASLRFSARCLRDVDPDVFSPLLASRCLDGFDMDATFAGVRCPALLLRGDEKLGGMLARVEAERLTSHMADGLLIDVPNVGHLIHVQATETTMRLVLSFLESL